MTAQIPFPDESKALTTSTVEVCPDGISRSLPESKPEAATSILAVIARAANDPACDVEKMERLLAMQEKIMAQQSRTAYYEALAKCQLELPVIPKNGKIKNRNGDVQSTFAKWEDINERIKPILQKHGFTLNFISLPCDNGVKVQARLSHIEGHQEESTVPAPIDVSGNKNNVQGIGSSLSYAKRYASGLLLNLTTADEDTDGNSPQLDAVSFADIEGVRNRWKRLNPKGTREDYERWIEETCGLLQPFESKNWRLGDLHACEVKLDGMEGK